MSYKLPLALIALAIVMLVGCKQPVGLSRNDVHAATTQTTTCYITASIQTGHVDWYQGDGSPWVDYDLDFGTITRAYDCYDEDPDRAWPRKDGFCIFQVPHIDPVNGDPPHAQLHTLLLPDRALGFSEPARQ